MLRSLFASLLVLCATETVAAELGGRLLGVLLSLKPRESMATYKMLFGHRDERIAADFDGLASRLGDAGAKQALANTPPQMTRSELAVILNDWGFWQNRGTKPADAIPTLQRVVELAPERAAAWRNLGDAARASLSGAITNPERKRLTRLAIKAYDTYRELTGQYQPDMKDFIEFNALNAPHKDVCRFVAGYYSRGRQHEITGVANPVDVDGSGRKLNLEVIGWPRIPYVKVIGADGKEQESAPAFGTPEDGRDIAFIPFGGAVYAVIEDRGEPAALNNWSGRRVCDFTAHDTASIAQSADDAVCKDLLAGSLTPVPPTTRLLEPKPIHIEDFWTDGIGQGITSITEIDLSGSGQTDRVGSFVGVNTVKGGYCPKAGVVLLDGDQPQSSKRNSALLAAEGLLQTCDNFEAFVVRDHDRPYVELDSRLVRRNEIPSRTLLRVTGSGIETVCRIVEHPTYTGLAK
jgi:hypothetical protein